MNNSYTNELSNLLNQKKPMQEYSSAWKFQDTLAHSYLPRGEEESSVDVDIDHDKTISYHHRNFRRKLFLLLTEPESSIASATVFAVLVVTISLSVVIMVIQTLPMYQYTPINCKMCGGTSSIGDDDGGATFVTNDDNVPCQCPPVPLPWTVKTQDIMIYVFTVEWILRVICFVPPSTEIKEGLCGKFIQWLSFLVEWGQIIDALAVFPYYLEHLNKSNSFLPLRLLRFTRVFRILRLGQYNDTFSSLLNVLRESSSSLNLLLIVVAFGACFFGSLMYFVERGKWVYTDLTDPPSFQYVRNGATGNLEISPFRSIPDCFWWFVVTATTVGYGDISPTSPEGKLIASFAMLMGVLVIAFPDFWGIELERRGKSLQPSNLTISKGILESDLVENRTSLGSERYNIDCVINSIADSSGMVTLTKEDLSRICIHVDDINRSRQKIKSILNSYSNIGDQSQNLSQI